MKKLILIIIAFIFVGCATKQTITIESNCCNDTQVFIDLAKKQSGLFKKDSAGAIMALTLVTSTYVKCLQERALRKASK